MPACTGPLLLVAATENIQTVGGQMDRQTDKQVMGRQTGGEWVEGQMDEGQMDGQTDGWLGWIRRWKYGRVERGTADHQLLGRGHYTLIST